MKYDVHIRIDSDDKDKLRREIEFRVPQGEIISIRKYKVEVPGESLEGDSSNRVQAVS